MLCRNHKVTKQERELHKRTLGILTITNAAGNISCPRWPALGLIISLCIIEQIVTS